VHREARPTWKKRSKAFPDTLSDFGRLPLLEPAWLDDAARGLSEGRTNCRT
jgi:hypothetical protein